MESVYEIYSVVGGFVDSYTDILGEKFGCFID